MTEKRERGSAILVKQNGDASVAGIVREAGLLRAGADVARDNEAKAEQQTENTAFVWVGLAADVAVAVAKLVVGLIAGSAAMLAEAAHSFADTTNQIFLLVGIKLSDRPADADHPYGHGKDRVFWAFLAAIFIFVSGAFFSLYHGILHLFEGENYSGDFWPSYAVLGFSFLFGLGSLVISGREARRRASSVGLSLPKFLREYRALTLKTTFYSDIAAVLGVIVAALGLILLQLTGDVFFDGLASVLIGLILVAVALVLVLNARDLILGAAAVPGTRARIRAAIESFPEVTTIIELLTMELGLASVLVTGKVELRDNLTTDEIEALMRRITARVKADAPDVKNLYLEPLARPASDAPISST
jgi:cation diffusion facilitator family transporter